MMGNNISIHLSVVGLNVFAHISVLRSSCDAWLSLHPFSRHRDTAESQPLFPGMLCFRQAAIYNNQLITQRALPDSQQPLHYYNQMLPPRSYIQAHTHACMRTRQCRRRRGRGGIYLSLFPCSSVVVTEDHPVWPGDGRQIQCYQTEGHGYEHSLMKRDLFSSSPPLSASSPPSEQVKLGTMFSIVSCRTTALFIPHHYTLMELCGEKINRGELPDSGESTRVCTQNHTEYVYI